jgi:YaiO family outer membrane protein
MASVPRSPWVLALACLPGIVPALAADGDRQVAGVVEAGASRAELTDGNASWSDQYLRGSAQVSPADRVSAEIVRQSHFADEGVFMGLGYTRILDDDWYATAGAGASDRGIFLPRLRLDGSAHRKWLDRRNLVTSLGVTYVVSRGPYRDVGLLLGATYYFESPWIVEAAARASQSSPGAMRSLRGLVAVTHGRDHRRYVTLRVEGGNEAWQVVAAKAVVVDFPSLEASLVWRQWLAGRWGVNLRAAHYRSANYDRTSVDLGVFGEF